MSLEPLLGEFPLEQFLERYYLKLPYALPAAAQSLRQLGSWQTLGQILAPSAANPAEPAATVDMLVARHDKLWGERRVPAFSEAVELFREGFTLVVRQAQRQVPPLSELAAGFAAELGGPVNIHMYFTPPGEHGFAWHYDAEEVFIVQTAGRKEYQLRKNTVQPWPLEETIPADMRFEREIMPLSRVTLAAGDWLYIPAGYWHRAEAAAELEPAAESGATDPGDGKHPPAAISLAIGVMAPAAIQILDFLRATLPASILWRGRLPIATAIAAAGEQGPIDQQAQSELWEPVLQMLTDDFRRTLRQPGFPQELLDYLKQQAEE